MAGKKKKSSGVEVIVPEFKTPTPPIPKVENSLRMQNGLAEAVGMTGGSAFPFNQGVPWSTQVSNSETMFKNLRWYLVSNFRQMLNQLYAEIGLVQTVCDVPVDDALRGGVEIKSKQLSEDEISRIQLELDRKNNLGIAGQAAVWNRLFGGAGILVLTNQDPEEPIDVESLSESDEVEFRAVDMWELFWDTQNIEGFDPAAADDEHFEFYSYYGVRVHKSRVMRMIGIEPPSFIRPRLRGWGLSIVETLVRSINQYFKGTDLLFEVLDEFKVDFYKIKNLVDSLMSPEGQQAVQRRISIANWQKNYQTAVVLDSEDEWDHKQLSWSGFGDIMEQIRMQVASDLRMPMIKLFGVVSAKGLNSSGEDEIEVYNSMVESQVRDKIKFPILRMVEIECQILFGFIPDDLAVSFKPLRILGAEAEENVKTQKFQRIMQARQAGEISHKTFIEGCNRGQLFDVLVDPDEELLNPPTADIAAKDGDDDEEPGVEKVDTQKSKTENSIQPYSHSQRVKRVLKNSATFDRKAYEADGGDAWIDPRRRELFMNPGGVDEALWKKAKEASQAALGEVRWQFVTWWYKKQGGKFH